MKFSIALFLSCTAVMIFGMMGCASSKGEIPTTILTPDEAFVHGDLVIKAWKSPAIEEGSSQPKQELEILVACPGGRPKRWVKLRQGQSFEWLTLESHDVSGEAVHGPETIVIPVLIEDFSLKVKGGVPKQYLILRDFSGGDAVAFYSDTAHPPLLRDKY